MAAAESERLEKQETKACSSLWSTCARWVLLLLQVVAAFIENATSISITIGRFLAFFGLKSLLCTNSAVASFPPVIPHDHHQLLPSLSGQDIDKLTVVLDLDETLVCAYESSSLPSVLHSQATQAGIKWFELQCLSVDKEGEGKQKTNHVTVYERPGLQEFLSKASEFAELVLFTAGLEGYARPLVDKIDSENRITARLYRPATVTTYVET